jgi:hypothetical protein
MQNVSFCILVIAHERLNIFAVMEEMIDSATPAERIMHSLRTVWAWYLSGHVLFSQQRMSLSDKAVALTQVQYKPFQAFRYDTDDLANRILPGLFPEVSWNSEVVEDLVRRTWSAKVHAEAALMGLTCMKAEVCSHGPHIMVSFHFT